MTRWIIATLIALFTTSLQAAEGKAVVYTVNGQDYEGYYASPGSEKAPLILLIHDWDGLTDYEVKRSHMLADMGYAVFAADLFGKGVRPTAVEDKKQHTGELYTDRQKMRDLMTGALKTAAGLGTHTDATVAMGYCFGGAAVLELARSGTPMAGFATFHGGLATPEGQDYSKTQGEVMVFHGTADTAITMEDFMKLAIELQGSGIRHEMISYSNAPHAFTVFGSDRYHEEADRRSWTRFGEFLKDVTGI